MLFVLTFWVVVSGALAQTAAPPHRFAPMSDEHILRIADVPRDHWAAEAVIRLYRLGVLQGYPQAQKAKPQPNKRKPR